MFHIFLLLFLIYSFFLIYRKYNFIIIYNLSYILAFIPYYLNIKKKVILNNLRPVFPDISDKKINNIIFHSWKNMIINIIVGFNMLVFSNTDLEKYYSVNKIGIPKKSMICLAHFGLYYDIMSFNKLSNKSCFGIYKGNFTFIFKKNINTAPHNKINIKDLYKYFCIYVAIDHKSDKANGIITRFLDKEYLFHSYLLNYSLNNNRSIYIYTVKINKYILEPNLIKIDTLNKSLEDIIHSVSNKLTKFIKENPEQYNWHFKLGFI